LQYAIVDIETTGGYAAANGITEIAVVISNGKRILRKFHTLLNPVYTIPKYISALTGITNEMVEFERPFSAVAEELFELLRDRIFVAHNVNFDYSFVRHHLAQSGYDLNCKKLCTVRLARKIVPGSPGYGLGKICDHLGIVLNDRHRALGDAQATARLLHYLLEKDDGGHAAIMIRGRNREQSLPPNVPAQVISRLPPVPGVYYFHDQKGKVIYVGKAKNLVRRVSSHFSNNRPNRQKQEFLKKIHDISFQQTGTELMAFILESIEIRKLWPEQNRSQKRYEPVYGLYCYEDRKGYMRLCIENKKNNLYPLYTFNLLLEGHNRLRRLVQEYALCPKRCFLQKENVPCVCNACLSGEPPGSYNTRVEACIKSLEQELPSFALIDNGLRQEEQSCILMEKGRFYGMGYLPSDVGITTLEECKSHLTPYSENDYIRGLVYQHAARYPDKKVLLR